MADAVNALPDAESSAGAEKYASLIQFSDLNVFGKSKVVLAFEYLTVLDDFLRTTVENTTVEEIDVTVEKQVTSASNAFNNTTINSALKKITLNVDFSQCTIVSALFWKLNNLEVIDGKPLDFSSAKGFGLVFNGCTSLKTVSFAVGTIKENFSIPNSSVLDDNSIQSVVDGLADLTGADTKTLTLTEAVKKRMTEEQIAAVTSKNWTLA